MLLHALLLREMQILLRLRAVQWYSLTAKGGRSDEGAPGDRMQGAKNECFKLKN